MEYGSALNLQSFSRPVRGDCFDYRSKLDYIEVHRNSIPQLTRSVTSVKNYSAAFKTLFSSSFSFQIRVKHEDKGWWFSGLACLHRKFFLPLLVSKCLQTNKTSTGNCNCLKREKKFLGGFWYNVFTRHFSQRESAASMNHCQLHGQCIFFPSNKLLYHVWHVGQISSNVWETSVYYNVLISLSCASV